MKNDTIANLWVMKAKYTYPDSQNEQIMFLLASMLVLLEQMIEKQK
jgi:hypothetical protein